MKQITTNNRTLLFVPVCETACDFQWKDGSFIWSVMPHMPQRSNWTFSPEFEKYKYKHNGMYRFIATTDTITEQQAAMFVETLTGMMCAWYVNYIDDSGFLGQAVNSFDSLLQHHSITGRHAIIEVL